MPPGLAPKDETLQANGRGASYAKRRPTSTLAKRTIIFDDMRFPAPIPKVRSSSARPVQGSRVRGRRPPLLELWVLFGVFIMGLASPARAQLEDSPQSDASILMDTSLGRGARVEAAVRLIESTILTSPLDEPPSLVDHPIVRALESEDPALAGVVLEALPRLTMGPRVLWHAVAGWARGDSPQDPRVLTAAIASFRTPDAAQALIRLCEPGVPEALREAAGARASELLGIVPATADAAWEWGQARKNWPRIRWADHISSVLAASVRAERARAEASERRLLLASRRLWASVPEADRPAMLDEFLSSEVDPLRLLAIELIREQIASGRAIPSPTTGIAIAQLRSPRAAVRADAAMLLAQIAPPEAAPSVLMALLAETDPRAAEQLLIASARWPTPEAIDPVLRWLSHRGATAIAAGDAAYALHRQGLLAPHVDRVVPALRSLDDTSINGGACRLLVELGDESDTDRVIALLGAQRPTLRLAAASALVQAPRALGALLAAAANDPNLSDAAVRAVLRHARDESGVRALDALSAPRARDAQREILAELPPERAFALAQRIVDDPCRLAAELHAILGRGPDTGDGATPADGAAPRPEPNLELIERLARAELDCGDAQGAFTTLAGIPPDRVSDDARTMLALACIRLGRLNDAFAHAPTPEVWVEEIGRMRSGDASADRVQALARFILEHFAGVLDDEASKELAALVPADGQTESEVPPPSDVPAPGGTPTDTSDLADGDLGPRD